MSTLLTRTYRTSVFEIAAAWIINDAINAAMGHSTENGALLENYKFGYFTIKGASKPAGQYNTYFTVESDSGQTLRSTNAQYLVYAQSSTSSTYTVQIRYIKKANAIILLHPRQTNSGTYSLFNFKSGKRSAVISTIQTPVLAIADSNSSYSYSASTINGLLPIVTLNKGIDISSDNNSNTMTCVPFVFPVDIGRGFLEEDSIANLYNYALPNVSGTNTTVLNNAKEFTFSRINSGFTYNGIKIDYGNESSMSYPLVFLY